MQGGLKDLYWCTQEEGVPPLYRPRGGHGLQMESETRKRRRGIRIRRPPRATTFFLLMWAPTVLHLTLGTCAWCLCSILLLLAPTAPHYGSYPIREATCSMGTQAASYLEWPNNIGMSDTVGSIRSPARPSRQPITSRCTCPHLDVERLTLGLVPSTWSEQRLAGQSRAPHL